AGPQLARGRACDSDRTRGALRNRTAIYLRSQELLLPRFAEELPNLAIRNSGLQGRLYRTPWRGNAQTGAPGANPYGGRRGQERSRSELQPRRLQPLGSAAGRDSERTRPPVRRRSGRLSARTARNSALHRRIGRTHGGRQLSMRRQRLGAKKRRDRVRNQDGNQKPQLLSFRREGDRLRSQSPNRSR